MNKTHGFSLLEVLVAFAILTVTLGVLLNIFSLTIRTTQSAQEQQRALLLAESKMVTLAAGTFLRLGQEQGRFDNKYWWQTRIETFDVHWMTTQASPLVPYRLSVTVGWGQQQLSLTSLRLVREEGL
ncbi:prepilin-type N-terminal cleavage/methylation domain-containing protein [Oceanisphaera sp. IT1-181]|uniref:type IV pilus modification PilV family protein n=1 Tax=Oceanisphaera sp. IT1-181 TaxID=3081199 RepID=UPI0029C9CE7A|nr:prepilin-type N-terminal cleavage/methylation domain-containing protein [Oceanisphaera sp. IT1-181]